MDEETNKKLNREFLNRLMVKISLFLDKPYTVLKFITFVLLLVTVLVLFKWGRDYIVPILILYALAFYMLFTRMDSLQEQLKRL